MFSKIYYGRVTHQRMLPREHIFYYQLFLVYLDIDELTNFVNLSPWWSLEKFNLAVFKRKDYHRPEISNLKEAVHQTIWEKTGIKLNGPVRMLSHFRYFGYIMNPVTFYYCFDQNNSLKIVLAEIENTPWGERYSYLLPIEAHGVYNFPKSFHVSPFFPLNLNYEWQIDIPREILSIKMKSFQNEELLFTANLSMTAQEPSTFLLNRILFKFPFMTIKVIAAIYFQAALLWVKKIPFYPHPNKKSQKKFLIFKGDKS